MLRLFSLTVGVALAAVTVMVWVQKATVHF